MNRARWLLVIGGLGVVIGSGGVAAAERSVSEQPKPRAVAAADLRGQRGTVLPPSVALDRVLAQIGASSLVSARIGLAPEGPDRESVHGHLPWLYATVRVPDITARVRPIWETLLIEGAVAELIGDSADLSDDIGGSVVEGVLPDGSSLGTIGGGMGVSDRGHVFSNASASEIAAAIRSVLPRYGLTEVSLQVLHPLGFAPALVVSSTEPRSALERLGDLWNDLYGDPPRYEGHYFELRDGSGTAIVRRADSWRTGARLTWAIPEYAPMFGIVTPER